MDDAEAAAKLGRLIRGRKDAFVPLQRLDRGSVPLVY